MSKTLIASFLGLSLVLSGCANSVDTYEDWYDPPSPVDAEEQRKINDYVQCLNSLGTSEADERYCFLKSGLSSK